MIVFFIIIITLNNFLKNIPSVGFLIVSNRLFER